MKIKIINPNSTVAFTNALLQLAQQGARTDTQILAVNPSKSPPSIEGFYDEALAIPYLLEEISAGEKQEVDAYVIACFGDPGLYAARELTNKPVIGIAEAAFHMAAMISANFTVVTTLPRVRFMTEHLLQRYGFNAQCKKVRTTPVQVLELATQPEVAINKIIAECLKAKEEDYAEAIVLGCAGMSAYRQQIEAAVGIPIVDGTLSAVKLCEALVDMRLLTSKSLTFAYPEKK